MDILIILFGGILMVERTVLKRNAKDQLRGKWGLAIAALIIFAIIPSIIISIGSVAESESIMAIGSIVAVIIMGPLMYGLCTFILNLVRDNNTQISDIFSGFNGKVFVKAFLIMLLSGIAIGIGYCILIIPGIILSLMLSQSFFVLVDNNDMSAIDCMKASCQMMNGNKGYLFVLMLSFIGWYILGSITCGIGYLWVYPYYNITLGNFYEQLKGSKTIEQ